MDLTQIIGLIFIPFVSFGLYKKLGYFENLKALGKSIVFALGIIIFAVATQVIEATLIEKLLLITLGKTSFVLIVVGYGFVLLAVISLLRILYNKLNSAE